MSAEGNLVLQDLAVARVPLLGGRAFVGVVINEGNETLPGVSLEFRFRNQEKKMEVGVRSTDTLLMGEIGPGEFTPFWIGFPEPEGNEKWDLVEISIATNEFGSFFGQRVPELEVTDIEVQRQGLLGPSIVGVLRNHGDEQLGGTGILEGFDVAVAGYDAQGQLVVVGHTSVSRILEPGWSTEFRIDTPLIGRAEDAVRFIGRALLRPSP